MKHLLTVLSISVLFLFQLHCEIIPFSIGGQIGFLEKNLDVIIKPEYQSIINYNADYFICKKQEAGDIFCKIISKDGVVLYKQNIPAMFIVYDNFFSYYTREGMNLIRLPSSTILYNALSFSHSESNYTAIKIDDKNSTSHQPYRFFDLLTGTMVDCRYRRAYGFFCGRAVVVFENWDYAFIDESFSIVKEFEFLDNHFSEGLIAGITKDGKTGFFDVDGKQVIDIPFRYDGLGIAATYFNGGYALVSMTDDRWRIIDRTGKNVKEISCLYADNFCDGLSRIAVSGDGSHKYRFVRTDGTFLTSLEFDEASSFCNGYARIVVNGIDGLLDTDGNIYLSNELLQGKKIRHTESEFYENK